MEELKLRAVKQEKAPGFYHNLKFLETEYLIDNKDGDVIESSITRVIGGWLFREVEVFNASVFDKKITFVPISEEHKPSDTEEVEHDQVDVSKWYAMPVNTSVLIIDEQDIKISVTKVANGWVWRETQYFETINAEDDDETEYQIEKNLVHIPYSNELIQKTEKNEKTNIIKTEGKIKGIDKDDRNKDETGNSGDESGATEDTIAND